MREDLHSLRETHSFSFFFFFSRRARHTVEHYLDSVHRVQRIVDGTNGLILLTEEFEGKRRLNSIDEGL